MRHSIDGRKFGRNTSHRLAMFRNMANSVIEKEQIITTVEKAKEVRRVVDRLITLAKRGSPHARRLAFDRTRNDRVVTKLFDTLAERYSKRPGGYTRVLKVAQRRWGDAAEMAVLELVDHPELDRKRKPSQTTTAGDGTQGAAPATQAGGDPFKRFRKIFSGKEKGGGKASKAQGGQAKTSVGRKTPTGGGKSGGSGS